MELGAQRGPLSSGVKARDIETFLVDSVSEHFSFSSFNIGMQEQSF
jgi:hypothetical protein